MALASQNSPLELARLANILAFDDTASLISFLTDIDNPDNAEHKQYLDCRRSAPKLK